MSVESPSGRGWVAGVACAFALTSLVACTEEPESPGPGPGAGYDGAVGDGGYTPPYGDGGWTADGGWGTTDGGAGGGDGGPVAVESGNALPAEVCTVLQKNACVTCHKTPTEGGANMALSTVAHFKAMALDGSPMAQKVLARAADTKLPMPPQSTGKSLMSPADLATLKAWIDGGMKGVDGTECAATGDRGDIGTDETPDWAVQPWPADQCEYVVTLGAHGQRGKPVMEDPTPYPIPNTVTDYHCFWEKVPWGDKKVQALAMRAIIETPDDKQFVHHFVVSGVEPLSLPIAASRPDGPGDHKNCMNPNGSTMGIWAPGAINPLTYPSDVGVLLPSGDSYIELQVHYNNTLRQTGKQSKVRYEICATSKLRPQTAGVFWLGYENAFYDTLISGKENSARLDNKNNGTAVGRCEAKTKGRILSIMPHMHGRGRHSKFEVVRKDGTVIPVIDAPYNFEDERSYFRQNFWVEPGDAVRATCQWDKGPVYFGFGTDAEMCFHYTLAYPIEVFKANPLEKGVVGGDLACAHALFP